MAQDCGRGRGRALAGRRDRDHRPAVPGARRVPALGIYAVAWAAFAAGAWLVLGVSPRRAVPVILPPGCTLINRPRVPTIYPPVAE
ncbi:MAG TPA: hypothetical protein VK586_23710, partial [Streptosporangiaceae bacterium]|nr:hypothetical protein [Streptosporangiaceae bacterium]